MALFNEIQVGRFNRFAQKLLSMKGPPSLPTLASDLQFVHPVDSGIENRYLQGWDLYCQILGPFTGTGQSLAELRNPSTSNAVGVLTRLAFSESVAESCAFVLTRNATADQTTVISTIPRQLDKRGRGGPSLIASDNSGAALTGQGGFSINYWVFTNAGVNVLTEVLRQGEEVLVLPGDAVSINTTSAASLTALFVWRERFLEDSERA